MAEKAVGDKFETGVDEFIVITKVANDMDGAMEIDTIDSLVSHNIGLNDDSNDDMDDMAENSEHSPDNSNSSRETIRNFYHQSISSLTLDEADIKQEWLHEESFISQDEDYDDEDIDGDGLASDAQEFGENPDEETIATFITSTGQQLALYAVEDSEEVFAVAVYSESGEPPTNFQFLMKADVERLIGEGAVKTVKKPQQMRKQTYQGELITSHDKDMYVQSLESPSMDSEVIEKKSRESIRQTDTELDNCVTELEIVPPLQEEIDELVAEVEEAEYMSVDDDLTYQDILDNSYFLLEQHSIKEIDPKLESNDVSKAQVRSPVKQACEDLDEKSTVQYILFGEDESDSELTFDEIQESLQHFDKNKKMKVMSKTRTNVKMTSPIRASMQEFISLTTKREIESGQPLLDVTPEIPARRLLQSSTVLKHKHVPNALLGKRNSNKESKKAVFIQTPATLIRCPATNASAETNCKETQDLSSRIKRSRKQQLTIVNRADSEIIIQPATMVSDDEEEERLTKKRGRRKKRRPNNFKNVVRSRGPFSKKIASSPKPPRIEVIEIDVDNDNETGKGNKEDKDGMRYGQRRSNIQEIITIEDGKEKGSSDKENEVIMVGDSDDEEENTIKGTEDEIVVVEMQTKSNAIILKCDHCSRSFRQKRALDTHVRVCPKSPTTRRRFPTTRRGSSTRSNDVTRSVLQKQYVCKICQEKFDVVVALARHVRSHYKKKKTVASVAGVARLKKKSVGVEKTTVKTPEVEVPDKKINQTQSSIEQKGKERLNVHRGWKSKKMSCIDCGRWFASVALLSAHALQHGTKKSEKRMKRCQICKKLFRSRPIYIRHMRMHSNAKQLQKRIKRTLQSTSTNSTLRKRGRPRKL